MPRGKHKGHLRGIKHHRWSGGASVGSHGYLRVRVGRGHPAADSEGWAYVHHLVWMAAGRRIPKGHDLHHKNGEKLDNRLANLDSIERSEHARHHAKYRQRDARGRFV